MPNVEFGDVDGMIGIWRAYGDSKRKALDYEIDGLVVRAADLHTSALLGELNHRPRAAVAFKFESEMQVTTLKAILWSTGDSGRITPIAQIEPVFLAARRSGKPACTTSQHPRDADRPRRIRCWCRGGTT